MKKKKFVALEEKLFLYIKAAMRMSIWKKAAKCNKIWNIIFHFQTMCRCLWWKMWDKISCQMYRGSIVYHGLPNQMWHCWLFTKVPTGKCNTKCGVSGNSDLVFILLITCQQPILNSRICQFFFRSKSTKMCGPLRNKNDLWIKNSGLVIWMWWTRY